MLTSLRRSNLQRLPLPPHILLQSSSFVEGARIRWTRDRGLDHVVEKEKHLLPLINLINLIVAEPSKSIPLSLASDMKPHLKLPTRAIDFLRKYPSVFTELPSSTPPFRPRIALTPDALALHQDLISAYASSRHDSADRLAKLLMLMPEKKMPIPIVNRLLWDLGLPDDYTRSVLPDFPDYFQVVPLRPGDNSSPLALELVCWCQELAVSAMERAARTKGEHKKGMPLAFPLQFSRGFDLEKKVKKWMEEWQGLPYISPYEDGSHLSMKIDIGEKWAVAVLHEIMHLLVSKKTEKENVLMVGEMMGLRSTFKKALANYPGIFYVSNKIRTSTVVLREVYKRDLLVEKHPLMGMRYQFIHLMHKEKKVVKAVSPSPSSDGKSRKNARVEEVEDDGKEEDESEVEGHGSSDSESEEEEEDNVGGSSSDSESESEEDNIAAPPHQNIQRGSKQVGRLPSETRRVPAIHSSQGSFSKKGNDMMSMNSRRPASKKGMNMDGSVRGRPPYKRSQGERRSSEQRTTRC
ncbi:hypothetical protein ACLOJK_021823 [Asimina triloba]